MGGTFALPCKQAPINLLFILPSLKVPPISFWDPGEYTPGLQNQVSENYSKDFAGSRHTGPGVARSAPLWVWS